MGGLVQGGAIAGQASGTASSPATIHYAGHVGVGMLVVLTLLDPLGGVWTPTSVSDSAGNVYNLVLGAEGAPYYGTGANNHVNPGVPFYVCQYPGVWVYDCLLSHPVDSSTVLTVHLSASASFYVNGTQFASLVTPAKTTPINDNSTPDVFISPTPSPDVFWGIPWAIHANSPNSNAMGVGLAGLVYPDIGVPGPESGPIYTVNPHGDTVDGAVDYGQVSAFIQGFTADVNGYADTLDFAAMKLGRGFGLAYDGSDRAPSSTVDSHWTLTGHVVADDSQLGAGGKRLDMTFESNGSWDAGAGYTGVCLSGDSTQQVSSWWDHYPVGTGYGIALAGSDVNTPSGPQPFTGLLGWWRALVGEPSLDPSVMGGAGLMDLTVFVSTTQTSAIHKPCDASPLTTLSQDVRVQDSNGSLPGHTGPITGARVASVMTGDLLVDGVVSASGVALESTLMGHEVGYRMLHQHPLPWFLPDFSVLDVYPGSQWNTMTAHLTVKVSMWFYPLALDPTPPPVSWTPVDDGPGPDVPPSSGALPGAPLVGGSASAGKGTGGQIPVG